MNFLDDNVLKKVLYTLLCVLGVAIITVFSIYLWYGNKIEENENLYSLEEFEEDFSVKEASSTEDKNISLIKNSDNEINDNSSTENNDNIVSTSKIDNTKIENKIENEKTEKVVPKKELNFDAPVDGEIIKDFANETLVYSKTLDEWTTHLGIDIKGNKTSIVKAAESGKIESIKNDPRFGLTVTIVHQNGFKTVYSNLLTTEFVKEGDSVEKGDTIATIGESASFEILDEPHLHFEMYKDEQAVNPTIYLK